MIVQSNMPKNAHLFHPNKDTNECWEGYETLHGYDRYWNRDDTDHIKARSKAFDMKRDMETAKFIERIWTRIVSGVNFRMDPDFVAVWENENVGYRAAKIFCLDVYFDRCMIQNIYCPESFTTFDMRTMFTGNDKIYIVSKLYDLNLTPEDEMLLKIWL